MHVTINPGDFTTCGHYRCIWPASYAKLTEPDLQVEIRDELPDVLWQRTKDGPRVVGLAKVPDTDVVVIQRALKRDLVDTIEHLQAAGVAVCFEIDDDFHALHPQNPAYNGTDPARFPHQNRDHLMRAANLADMVVVSTPALAKRYGAHGRVRVCRNQLPDDFFAVARPRYDRFRRDQIVGWTGSVAYHPGDLEVVRGGVFRGLRGTRTIFRALGDPTAIRMLGTPGRRQEYTPWQPFGPKYLHEVSRLDVGIVPLDWNHPFNHAKSDLKGLEFAGLGIAAIASPTPEYRLLADQDLVTLARNPRDWERELNRLATNPELVQILGHQRRQHVQETRTYRRHAWEWVEAWQAAIDHRRQQCRPGRKRTAKTPAARTRRKTAVPTASTVAPNDGHAETEAAVS